MSHNPAKEPNNFPIDIAGGGRDGAWESMEGQVMSISIHPIFLLLSSLSYSYFLVTKIPKGILRVVFVLPVLHIFLILPWHFSSSFLRGILAFFITWIASFKLLLFCFDRGPLLTCKNHVDFIAVAAFPLKVREHNHRCKTLNSGSLLKVAGRYELVPLFNQPYFATSLQDFWGRRWNRLSSNILRLSVYNPTREMLSGIIGFGKARVAAMITTLAVSGIMHEVMFYYITCGMRPAWEVTWFFILHGLCMGFEVAFRARGWAPFPPAVSVPLTVGFTVMTCYWLLILPVWRNAHDRCNKK